MIERLRSATLYGIVDLGYVRSEDAPRITSEMLRGGVDLVQLRAKHHSLGEIAQLGRELHAITCDAGVPLIINDHAAIARDIGAEGVHVGQDDASVADVRVVIGAGRIVGKSTHSVAQAEAARLESPDYIGFGPLFATPTKPDYVPIGLQDIARAHEVIDRPIFCIGGIKLENLAQVIAAGARRAVIVSGLLQAPDIVSYARRCKELLNAPRNLATPSEHIPFLRC